MTDQPALIPERERFEAAKTPRNYLYWLNAYANGQGRQPDELHALCSYGHTVILGQQSEIDRLRADLATAREALERAASGLREAYDYGYTWPIGIDTEPQEQRGMERDTFIRNMELLERETRDALDRIGAQHNDPARGLPSRYTDPDFDAKVTRGDFE